MFKSINWLKFVLLFTVALGVVSCGDDDAQDEVVSITATAQSDADLSSLVAALTKADLASTLAGTTDYTVFAPTNEAFNTFLAANNFATLDEVPTSLLTSILLNHVVAGDVKSTDLSTGYYKSLATSAVDADGAISLFINTAIGVVINGNSTVRAADIEASNGTIHKVDEVIATPNIVDFALSNPNFSILVEALTRDDLEADFVGILSGDGPFTVFAPTNDAFADLLMELGVSELGDIPKETLEAALSYHVINGANVEAEDLADNTIVATFQGEDITINTTGGAVITDANGRMSNIIITDVQGSNGVIHAIDKVILHQQ